MKKTERFKEVRRHRGYRQLRMSTVQRTLPAFGEENRYDRAATMQSSFTEIVESRAGFCHNLKETVVYEAPS